MEHAGSFTAEREHCYIREASANDGFIECKVPAFGGVLSFPTRVLLPGQIDLSSVTEKSRSAYQDTQHAKRERVKQKIRRALQRAFQCDHYCRPCNCLGTKKTCARLDSGIIIPTVAKLLPPIDSKSLQAHAPAPWFIPRRIVAAAAWQSPNVRRRAAVGSTHTPSTVRRAVSPCAVPHPGSRGPTSSWSRRSPTSFHAFSVTKNSGR